MKMTNIKTVRDYLNAYNNLSAARAFMAEYDRKSVRDEHEPCEHGHRDCSTHKHGPCMDEVLSNFPQLADHGWGSGEV